MTRRWLTVPASVMALAALLAALTAGCGTKPDAAAPGAPPTAAQAQESQKMGAQAKANAEAQGRAMAAQHP